MVDADMGARAGYEERAAHSEPTPLETGEPAEFRPHEPVG
jgi:hypothetical protein